jgi:hypothetical protein
MRLPVSRKTRMMASRSLCRVGPSRWSGQRGLGQVRGQIAQLRGHWPNWRNHRQPQCIGLAVRALVAFACRSPQIVRARFSSPALAFLTMPWKYPPGLVRKCAAGLIVQPGPRKSRLPGDGIERRPGILRKVSDGMVAEVTAPGKPAGLCEVVVCD